MKDIPLLIYSNEPVIKYEDKYYAKLIMFSKFMAELSVLSNNSYFIIPCKIYFVEPNDAYTRIKLPQNVIEVMYYEGHFSALVTSLINAIIVRRKAIGLLRNNEQMVIAGPGPYSFMYWISIIMRRSTRFLFIIRGDSSKTLKFIYRNMLINKIVGAIKYMYQKRIINIANDGRAIIFVFGRELRKLYPTTQKVVFEISPLIESGFVRSDMRKNIPENRPLKVLYVGRLSKEKNIMSLIKACKLSSELGETFYLKIAGYGNQFKEIIKYIEGNSLEEIINVCGYVRYGDELKKLYDNNDILCLPSLTEGVPGVVIEAFARAMPVVATPVGSLPFLFSDDIQYIEGNDPEDILKSIRWCGKNRNKISSMGRKAQRKIDKYLITENVTRIREILESMKFISTND